MTSFYILNKKFVDSQTRFVKWIMILTTSNSYRRNIVQSSAITFLHFLFIFCVSMCFGHPFASSLPDLRTFFAPVAFICCIFPVQSAANSSRTAQRTCAIRLPARETPIFSTGLPCPHYCPARTCLLHLSRCAEVLFNALSSGGSGSAAAITSSACEAAHRHCLSLLSVCASPMQESTPANIFSTTAQDARSKITRNTVNSCSCKKALMVSTATLRACSFG